MYVPKIQINGVEVDRPNPDNGEGLQPTNTSNPIMDAFVQSAVEGNMNARNISPHIDWKEYERLNIRPNAFATEQSIESIAADKQSTFEKISNTLIQLFGNEILLGSAKAFVDLGDVLTAMVSPDKEVGSYISPLGELLENAMDKNRETYKIYRKDPEAYFDVDDLGWYLNNVVQFGTTVSLFAPSYGLERLGSSAAKGVKGLMGLNKEMSFVGNAIMKSKRLRARAVSGKLNRINTIKAIDNITSSTTQALISRTIENRQEAREVYRNKYNEILEELYNMDNDEFNKFLKNNQGRGYEHMSMEDIAKDIADVGATDTFVADYAMLGMDILQFAGINKLFSKKLFGKAASRDIKEFNKNIIKDIEKGLTGDYGTKAITGMSETAAKKLKSSVRKSNMFIFGMEGIGEGFEEMYQGVMSNIGETTSSKMIDPTIEYRGLDSYITDPAIWEQGFWGMLGGFLFQGLGAAVNKGRVKGYIRRNKDKLTDEDISLLKMGYDIASMKELEYRAQNTDKLLRQLYLVNKGFNPFNPITDEAGVPTGEYKEANDVEQQIIKQKLLDNYLLDLYTSAIRHNNSELMTDFVNSDEFKNAMNKALGNNEEGNATIDVLDRFNKIVATHDDIMYALSSKYTEKNPFAINATAHQIMQSIISRDNYDSVYDYATKSIKDTEDNMAAVKEYTIAYIQKELRDIDRQIEETENMYKNGYISDGNKLYVSKNVRDARIRQLKKHRAKLFNELLTEKGFEGLEEFKDEIKSLNISEETYKKMYEYLDSMSDLSKVHVIDKNDREYAEIRAHAMAKRAYYDSFIPKTSKEYEEAYKDIAASMDMGIANKLKQDFENVKKFIEESDSPVQAYRDIMEQNEEFMKSIDKNLRESIYALQLGTDIFRKKDNFLYTYYNTIDNKLLATLAYTKQIEKDTDAQTQSNTTTLSEEQKQDDITEEPKLEIIEDGKIPATDDKKDDTNKDDKKDDTKKEEKKKKDDTEKENKEDNKKEKKEVYKIEDSSTGEQIVIDIPDMSYIDDTILDDQSSAEFSSITSMDTIAEYQLDGYILKHMQSLSREDRQTLRTDDYKNTKSYSSLIDDMVAYARNMVIYTKNSNGTAMNEDDRTVKITEFVKQCVDKYITVAKKIDKDINKIDALSVAMASFDVVDEVVNVYSSSKNIDYEGTTYEKKDVDKRIEQFIVNYVERRKIIKIRNDKGKSIIDAASLLRAVLNSEVSGKDKIIVLEQIYNYIKDVVSGKIDGEYSFHIVDSFFDNAGTRDKTFKNLNSLITALINTDYNRSKNIMDNGDKVLRIAGAQNIAANNDRTRVIINRLLYNKEEWNNVEIKKVNGSIRFVYLIKEDNTVKEEVEIGFLQDVGKDYDNNFLYKLKNIFRDGHMLNNSGFVFDIKKENDSTYKTAEINGFSIDEYFNSLIEAAKRIDDNNAHDDAVKLLRILLKMNIKGNTNNRELNFMNKDDIKIAFEILNNSLIRKLHIGDENGLFGGINIRLQSNVVVKVKVLEDGPNDVRFVYYTVNNSGGIDEGNTKENEINAQSNLYEYQNAAVQVANTLIQATNAILLHDYEKIKFFSEGFESPMEFTEASLKGSYETFKHINYTNMEEQLKLQQKLVHAKENEKVPFEFIGFEKEKLNLDTNSLTQFSDFPELNAIDNLIVIPNSGGIITETGVTLPYTASQTNVSDMGILITGKRKVNNPSVLWFNNGDMNLLDMEGTHQNDANRKKLRDAINKELNKLFKELASKKPITKEEFTRICRQLSKMFGGRNTNRGSLFTGVDIVYKWNDESNSGAIGFNFDNKPIKKDEESGKFVYDMLILTGSESSKIDKPAVFYRDAEYGIYLENIINKGKDKDISGSILKHVRFSKSFYVFKNKYGNQTNTEEDNWYLDENNRFVINIGDYKQSYPSYGSFLISHNAVTVRLQKGSIKTIKDDSHRTPSFVVYFGDDARYKGTSSPVEGNNTTTSNTYDKESIDKLIRSYDRKKNNLEIDVKDLLKSIGTNGEFIDLLFGKNPYGISILTNTVTYDKNSKHYARYNRSDKKIYLHKKLFVEANSDVSNGGKFIRRELLHENIHRIITEKGLRYDDTLINDLIETFIATVESSTNSENSAVNGLRESLEELFNIVYDSNGKVDFEATVNKFTNTIFGEKNNISTNDKIINFVEEWLVESITQSGLINYMSDTTFTRNGKEVEIDNNYNVDENKSIFQKIIDILLKLFGINLQERNKNSIFAQQYKLLNNMNNDAIAKTKRSIEIKQTSEIDTQQTIDFDNAENEEVNEEPTKDVNEENNQEDVNNEMNNEENNEEDEDDNYGNIDDIDDVLGNDRIGRHIYRNDNDASFSASRDIIYSDSEIVINNYANNPTCNTNGVTTVRKIDDFLDMFEIEEKALIAENLENGGINYVCR